MQKLLLYFSVYIDIRYFMNHNKYLNITLYTPARYSQYNHKNKLKF